VNSESEGSIFPYRITDVRAAEGKQFLAQAPLTAINISVADPSATLTIHSLSLGIFLHSILPELRPGLNGQITFIAGVSSANNYPLYTKSESVNYVAPIPGSVANLPIKVAGIVVLGRYQLMRATLTRISDVKWVKINIGETTLTAIADLAGLALGGVFLDNVTYSVTTPT